MKNLITLLFLPRRKHFLPPEIRQQHPAILPYFKIPRLNSACINHYRMIDSKIIVAKYLCIRSTPQHK